ncbi:MAG: hypothetical protein O2794_02320 [bacterium]|nr:hypothetical protein [bacterium]
MKMWMFERQASGIIVIIVIFLIIVGGSYWYFAPRPSCFDGIRNGDEAGTDCGGSCQNQCLSNLRDPVVLWSRFFGVRSGVYDGGAMIENLNIEAGAREVTYTFRLYDSDNVLLSKKDGSTFILPGQQTFVYESNLITGPNRPSRIDFEVNSLTWERFPEEDHDLEVEIINQRFEFDENPAVRATFANRSLFEESQIEAYVLLEDDRGTVYAASSSQINNFEGRTERDVLFTWPTASFRTPGNVKVFFRRGLP